ncbi:MAG: hypothetical protein PHS86_10845 [Syntrophaceae bacterium]|nr:hypothetical protein [Syntrophaceae bacterium]
MIHQWLNALWALGLLFIKEIFYQGPLHHQETARRVMITIPAALFTLGFFLAAGNFMPFLTLPFHLLPEGLFWERLNAHMSFLFLLASGITLYFWENLIMTGISRRILLPVLPGPFCLVMAKLMAHSALVLILGLSFLLPSLLYIAMVIVPIIQISMISFSWHFLLGSLALIWICYFAILTVRVLLNFFPMGVSSFLSVLFRLCLFVGLVLMFIAPADLLEPWLGSSLTVRAASPYWPVYWSMVWIMTPFQPITEQMVEASSNGLELTVLLPVLYLGLQWMSLRLSPARLNTEIKAKPHRAGSWPAFWREDVLVQFFFRSLKRTNLIRQFVISMAVPMGIALAGVVSQWKKNCPSIDRETALFVVSCWLTWALLMLIWFSGKSVATEGLWFFEQLPREGLLGEIRRAYFKISMVWLFVVHLSALPALTAFFSWDQSLRILTLGLIVLLSLLLVFLRGMNHIPFTSRLLPDHWQIRRFWLLYKTGYIMAVRLMSILLSYITSVSLGNWAVLQFLGLALLGWLWYGLQRTRQGEDLILEARADPIIHSIEDQLVR